MPWSKAAKSAKPLRKMGLVGKVMDFVFYILVALMILAISLMWLPRREALITATVMFIIASVVIVYVSLSSTQKKRIKFAPYHQINYKIFSPFALVFSFAVICYLLNDAQTGLFVGSKNASLVDFSIFAVDNILRVVFWDLPEIYGISATRITHNVDNLPISTLVFLFRTLIGLSLIRMMILLLRN